jgi:hypothetical protein
MIYAISSPSHRRIEIAQCIDLVPPVFAYVSPILTSALRTGRLSSFLHFELVDECSEMPGHGSSKGVVLVFQATR